MLASIWEDVKREFSYGNMVTRLIIINLVFFVLINLVKILMYVYGGGVLPDSYETVLHFFCISSDWKHDLLHPWTVFTSMFLHEGFWHILWNMLFLYWFGRIVGDFIGNHRVFPIYLLGGLTGALIFFLSANFLPYGGEATRYALGASAGVMAIVVAAGVISPDYIMRVLLIGDVKLKYIVVLLLFLDLMSIAQDSNTGGHFAHLGGAFFGWFFITRLRAGDDWSEPVNNMQQRLSDFFTNINSKAKGEARKPKMVYKNKNVGHRSRSRGTDSKYSSHQEELDSILEKIKKDGYESLSKDEKEFLFKASKK